jgi:hypothetical protein
MLVEPLVHQRVANQGENNRELPSAAMLMHHIWARMSRPGTEPTMTPPARRHTSLCAPSHENGLWLGGRPHEKRVPDEMAIMPITQANTTHPWNTRGRFRMASRPFCLTHVSNRHRETARSKPRLRCTARADCRQAEMPAWHRSSAAA